ncbi:MAG: cation diffusion facilitator family transporter [Planctomycetota bacterium]|jgi:ferrous-iron efflux pump FieF|nr:cation diffusion facilitator family transporter [Planctomycetota bacterium]MDP6941995.1 cation diffusion facilitator family transporter [Planctomycetota bacterium]
MNTRSRTAFTTVKVALALVLLKAVTWLVTSSSGVLGSATDSLLDVLASLLVLWAILHAERPADAGHPWGHGKAESLASLGQALFILFAGCGLIFQVVHRWLDSDAAIQMPWTGIAVMVVSSLVTFWWLRKLRAAAKETGSPALEADSAHYAADILLNLGVVAGLLLSLSLNKSKWPDLVVGLAIGLLILNTARKVFLSGVENLMDRGLSEKEEAQVLASVAHFSPRVAGFHELRTRRSGSEIFLEIHIDIHRDMTFVDAHDLSEEVGRAIESTIPRSRVTVHADPL